MKNWLLIVGLFLAVGMTVSETAKAEFPGMAPSIGVGVNVKVGYRAPVPCYPAPIYSTGGYGGGFSHGFQGATMFPPPIYPRPYCGGQMMNPYAFGGYTPYCAPRPRPRRKHFSMAIRFCGFGFSINTGSSYY